jgi:hypothetical protein
MVVLTRDMTTSLLLVRVVGFLQGASPLPPAELE